jgi:putative transposase
MKRHTQQYLFKNHWSHNYSYGGSLRAKRAGRGKRPLSSKEPLHLVFKINREKLRSKSLRTPSCYRLLMMIIKQYSKHFFVRVDQISIQGDHCHLLVRATRHCLFHHFFRVVAGQIAQRFEKEGWLVASVTGTPRKKQSPVKVTGTPNCRRGAANTQKIIKQQNGTRLWKHRPFTRVVLGYKAYQIVRNYIQLNEKEALGKIKYQKNRLRGLSSGDWKILWS